MAPRNFWNGAPLLDAEPFRVYLEQTGLSASELAVRAHGRVNERRLRAVLAKEQERVSELVVEAVGIELEDDPRLVERLYGPDLGLGSAA